MTLTESLAAYIGQFQREALPEHVVQKLQSCLLYNLSMAAAGYQATDPVTAAIAQMHADSCGSDSATVFLTGARRAPSDAAYANAAAITARGQNDTLRAANGHIGCVVIPAVLALAQVRSSKPADVLAALAAGYEVQAKVAKSGASASTARGFRATSVYGTLGAAAGASRVLGLDQTQTANALAIASSSAAGIMQCWSDGSMEWRLHVAQASQAGVVAALLAEGGVIGAPRALEGNAGFFRAFAGIEPAPLLSGWDIEQVVFKPYPGCAINQAPVDALLRLLDEEQLNPEQVRHITLTLSPSEYDYPGVREYGPFPSASGAIMSAPFMMAAALRDGIVTQRVFQAEFSNDQLLDLAKEVTLQRNDDLPKGHCEVSIHLDNGNVLTTAFKDESRFRFDWPRTLTLGRALADEWPFDDAVERLGRLTQAVLDFDSASDVTALIEPLLP